MIKTHDTFPGHHKYVQQCTGPNIPTQISTYIKYMQTTHTKIIQIKLFVSIEKTVLWSDFDVSLSLKFFKVYCLVCHSLSVFCGTIMRQGLHHQYRLIGITFRLYLPLVSGMVSITLYHHVNNCCRMLPPPESEP